MDPVTTYHWHSPPFAANQPGGTPLGQATKKGSLLGSQPRHRLFDSSQSHQSTQFHALTLLPSCRHPFPPPLRCRLPAFDPPALHLASPSLLAATTTCDVRLNRLSQSFSPTPAGRENDMREMLDEKSQGHWNTSVRPSMSLGIRTRLQ